MRRELLVGHDEEIARFVAQCAPIERPVFTPPFWGFGVLEESGHLCCGVVFSDWKPDFKTLELSVAAVSSACLSTEIVFALGDFVFRQLNAFRIFARTGASNKRAQRLLRHVGFTQEAVQAHYYGAGVHATCWRMIKPEWEQKTARIGLKAA